MTAFSSKVKVNILFVFIFLNVLYKRCTTTLHTNNSPITSFLLFLLQSVKYQTRSISRLYPIWTNTRKWDRYFSVFYWAISYQGLQYILYCTRRNHIIPVYLVFLKCYSCIFATLLVLTLCLTRSTPNRILFFFLNISVDFMCFRSDFKSSVTSLWQEPPSLPPHLRHIILNKVRSESWQHYVESIIFISD